MVIEQVIGSRLEICLKIFPLSCHRTIGYPWKYISTVEVGILGKEYFLTEAKALSVILRTSLFSSTRKLIFQERRTFLLRISYFTRLGDLQFQQYYPLSCHRTIGYPWKYVRNCLKIFPLFCCIYLGPLKAQSDYFSTILFIIPFKQCSFGLPVSLELPKVQPRLPLVSTDCTIRLQICLQTKPDTFSLGSFCGKAQGPVKLHSFPGKGLANHFKLGLKKLSRDWYSCQNDQTNRISTLFLNITNYKYRCINFVFRNFSF